MSPKSWIQDSLDGLRKDVSGATAVCEVGSTTEAQAGAGG